MPLKKSMLGPEIFLSFAIVNIKIVLQWRWLGFVVLFWGVCVYVFHLKIKATEPCILCELSCDLNCATVILWLRICMLTVVLIVVF